MKILNYREQNPATGIVAIFDLEVDVKIPEIDVVVPWINRNWKLRRAKNGGLYPLSPSFVANQNAMTNAEKWASYDEIDPKFAQEIKKQIMQILEPFLKPEDIKS